MSPASHILVVFENSRAGKRALRDAAAIADEHRARISVARIVEYERRTYGCCIRSVQWNQILDEVALDELALARDVLGERYPPPRFEVVPGRGDKAIPGLVDRLGCDLVLVPSRRIGGRRSLRRLRSSLSVDIQAVRAA